MTKRSSEFDQKNNKKLKLEKDIEALWGDDIDGDALEDCINLASQIYQEEKITCTQLNNVTLLPTYSAFKQRNVLFSSTQLSQVNNSVRPSTSKNEFISKKITSGGDLQEKVNTLQEQYKEKEGEVSVLRAQLQVTKSNLQSEQQKLQNEWKNKLTQSERQVKSVKSELEFKNLEIANLKQKMLEITKHSNLDASINVTQTTANNIRQEKTIVNEAKVEPTILQPVLEPIYPLKNLLSETIVNLPKREQHITETRLMYTCKNAVPYLKNQTMSANVVIDKSDINIDCVYPDILNLIKCTEDELDDKKNIHHLNKIICACEQFLYDLQQFLEQIKGNLRTEDILEADSSFLKSQDGATINSIGECSGNDEIGVKSSVLLNFLAHIVPYNEYLKKYICLDKALSFEGKEMLKKQFPYQVIKRQNAVSHSFLNIILNIVQTAGEIRKATFMSKFLNAAINLLIYIHKSKCFDNVSDIFFKLMKEIILSRPTVEVICQITFLFKTASQHSSFVEFLINKSPNSVTSKKGILYFNEDACRFYIFVMLFDNTVFVLKNESFPLKICLNLLCFMYNTFTNCHWIHHRDAKECECIPQLYKLEIEVVLKALERYIEETKKLKLISSEWSHFFKHPITTKVLNQMTFHAYELTEKYITVFSQYKEIEKSLQREDDLIELDKLNITDEIVEIPSDTFTKACF
ncbi:uncharacterized protein LOC108914921 [Anoplophora glabripennis]|uniref:uncharacterized protein LOC108914921 n=1 Tax=Anoplophora glabripennis TaxID=217634 RepID=UPI0008755C17|nr:uncharacterized protein LOC108914921 [Anoplophora glabripennis]